MEAEAEAEAALHNERIQVHGRGAEGLKRRDTGWLSVVKSSCEQDFNYSTINKFDLRGHFCLGFLCCLCFYFEISHLKL